MNCPLEHIKQYMQITHDADDTLIAALIEAAEDYLSASGISPTSSDNRFFLAVAALTLHWYDNRQAVDTGLTDVPLGLRQLINQLKAEGVRRNEA